jgi:cytosine/adenosine deaminase-related metal-dependent hydrolase
MDDRSTIMRSGTLWIKDATIAAITADAATPDGFDGIAPVDTGGTIFPGLIELHNHTAYNVLPLWHVPKRYGNRDTWGNSTEYHQLVTAPMKTIGEATELLGALVRYVEVKALLGGVTTTQGIALFSAPGIRRFYKGIVRNVEQTGDKQLFPEAASRIADVDAHDPEAFLAQIEKVTCFLLHLSEGTDAAAHRHFKALKLPGDQWAITPSLAGIHCVALTPSDFQILARRGASMVWSPFSNLLLYGSTARMAAAKAAASLKVGLGSDWSPSGSKSLFGELKVARVYSQNNENLFTDEELIGLATRNGARILGWQDHLGTIEVGKRADLVVIADRDDDAHAALFDGDERLVQLVVINGTTRYGSPAMMTAEGPGLEKLTVGGENRVLYLKQDEEDPEVSALGFAEACAKLKDALHNIKELRVEQEARAPRVIEALASAPAIAEGHPRLALDEFEHTAMTFRPHLPVAGSATGPKDRVAAPGVRVSSLLAPIELDPPTVADDPGFLDRVDTQTNLPGWLAPALRELY